LEEVLRKSAELEKIAIADCKAKMSKCPPIEKTEEAEPAAPPPPAARRPKPPGIFYPPAAEEVGVRVGSFPACAACLLDLD
jgi:hypothetical protein